LGTLLKSKYDGQKINKLVGTIMSRQLKPRLSIIKIYL